MRSVSPNQQYYSTPQTNYTSPRPDQKVINQYQSPKQSNQFTTILKPIVYEAMHVPINNQIIPVRQQIAQTNTAPQSGQQSSTIKQSFAYPMQTIQQDNVEQSEKSSSQRSDNNNQQQIKNHSIGEFQPLQTQEISKQEMLQIRELEDRIRLYKQDCDLWKQKFNASEHGKQQEIQQIELRFKDELHSQLISQKQIYQASLADMGEEMKHLQRELDISNRDCEKVRQKCHQLELDQFEIKSQQVDAIAQRDYYEKECQRLQSQLQKIKHDYEEYRVTIEIGRKRIVNEQELEKLKDIIVVRENEIDDLKVRNSQLESMCVDIRKLQNVNEDLLNQVELLNTQIQISEQKLIGQRNEIDDLIIQNRKLQNQLQNNKNNEKIQKTFYEQDMLNQIHQLQQQLIDKEGQLKQQQQSQQIIQQQINEYERKLQQQKECYESEIDDLKEKQSQFENEFQSNIAQKFQLLNKEIQQLQKERSEMMNELSELQQNRIMQDTKIQQYQKENENYIYQLQLKAQQLTINQENINILNKKFKQLENENQSLNQQLHKLHFQYQDSEKMNYQFNQVLCYIEMEAMRDRLQNTLKELEQIKQNSLSMYKYQK